MAVESGWHRKFKQAVVNNLSEKGYQANAEHTVCVGYAKRRVDIALPEHRIAIELWTSRYGPKRARAAERSVELLAAGWIVLDVAAPSDRACLMYVRKDVEKLVSIQASDDSPARIAQEKGLPGNPYERSLRFIYLYDLYNPVEECREV
jgi:hypothetical protein